jgi:predicted metal-binding membrane protein
VGSAFVLWSLTSRVPCRAKRKDSGQADLDAEDENLHVRTTMHSKLRSVAPGAQAHRHRTALSRLKLNRSLFSLQRPPLRVTIRSMLRLGGHDRPPTLLEATLRSERVRLVVPLVVVLLVCWLWIVVMARDMYGPMTGASAWMMTAVWDVRHLALLWAMWAVMMVAMMLPSAAPLLVFYARVVRQSAATASLASRQVYALAAGYLVIWMIFSVGATALQRVMASLLLMSPMMVITSPRAGALLLLLAGVYQFTPIKQSCLGACRSPLLFVMSRAPAGVRGAFRMGCEHGALCVGCCWALMLLLFVGGVMNLTVIATLTALVAFEKLAPFGRQGARISGGALIVAGGWMLVS